MKPIGQYSGEYGGYQLDVPAYTLTEKEEERIKACIYLVDHGYTLRQVEADLGISDTTLDVWVHAKLPSLSYELYKCVCKQFKINLERRFKR